MALRADRPPAVRARGNRAEYDDLRAATRAFGTAIRRSESAGICVLSVRRRMLCPSRWVIPGLAAAVTGWSADQRVPTAAGLRAAGRRACRFDSAGPGCRRDGWPGCCGQLRGGGTGLGHPPILSRAALAHDLRAGPDPQSAPNPASRRMVVPIQQRAQVEVGSRCSTFARTVIAKRC